ncbi:hypothetical protein SRB17_81550 [Streptomyces sp. RB17]|uniref:hypothetical protein n=1 Tax=Streptomyces sp. RB17 TaxID=2585197 RepID=UPI001309EB4F|nr:hypothetical protein [Streptomyces sp. RB17]MQY40125.1 hypothetical protein [Streptomyces sp. RB17]
MSRTGEHSTIEVVVRPGAEVCAWLSSLSPTVIPIPGASRPQTIRDAAASELTPTAAALPRLTETARAP